MWILESSGDFLQGKRMWLKPGKKYLFGRVKKDGVRFAIDHKTVSRKHFIISVDEIKEEDVGQVHARSKVIITDENSKAGTNVDGELLRGKSKELKDTLHSIRPGSCPNELVVTWIPVIMTFSLTKKEIKSGMLKQKQERVRELDIKAVSDYLPGQTTHLVVAKRNTAKSLQALIEGRYIVTEAYIDALIYSSTPTNLQEEENLCPLELDFDDGWPDPLSVLPPRGKEPTDKPAEAYKPEAARGKIFDKFTFVFFDQQQYDTLLPPITTGHGKALLYNPDVSSTNVEDGVTYMRNVAGFKTVSSATDVVRKTAVLMVKLSSEESSPLSGFIDQVAAKIDVEPVDQSQFLDAILSNDASQLRKPYQSKDSRAAVNSKESTRVTNGDSTKSRDNTTRASISPQRSNSPNPSAPHTSASQSSHPEDSPRPRKRARFMNVRNNPLDNFDDDFNPDAIAAYDEDDETPALSRRTHEPRRAMSEESQLKQEARSTPGVHHSQPESDSNVDESMDDLLPATTTMRARDAEARRNGRAVGAATPLSSVSRERSPKREKLMDVRATVKAQREAEEAVRKREKEAAVNLAAEEENLGKGPANLVQIHEYELPVRDKNGNVNGKGEHHGSGWKPEWDDRKNFKGFRRARDVQNGSNGTTAVRKNKIIVPVVEVKKNSYGMGDEYWSKTQEDKERDRERARRKAASQRTSQSQNQSSTQGRRQRGQTVPDDSESDGADPRDEQNGASDSDKETNTETARLQAEAASIVDHVIDVDEPRTTRAHDAHRPPAINSKFTAVNGATPQKRHASSTPQGRMTNGKKQKTLPVIVVDSDNDDGRGGGSDSDDLKFKFGRAKKGRA